jgi:glycosyltransferase involved in cell wall biosynthesis
MTPNVVPEPLRGGNGAFQLRRSAAKLAGDTADRVRVDGKFFRLGRDKFWVRGVTYGPFRPNSLNEPLPEPAQVERDFRQLGELGANTIRLYHAPPEWLLDKAAEHNLKVLVDAPFAKNRLFLDFKAVIRAGREAVRRDVRSCKRHPAVLGYVVANEIPPDIVRLVGATRVERYLDELVDIAKQEDPEGLATGASFPPTEYLHAQAVDFYTMNVYLHSREKLRAYLQRLQNQTDEKPLLLGEYGIDTIREGEQQQAELVAMHVEEVFRAGLTGSCIFSYTDEWFTNGHEITDWAFGLVERDRTPKPALKSVAQRWRSDPLPRLQRYPRVSVVVCSYNGGGTLEGCLESLSKLNYPDYEVILVDDGSSDATRQIAQRFPHVRYHHQRNHGLSVARNVGMDLATGEIIAYTDSDCFADEDWLYFLVSKLLETGASAVGGPNLLPSHDGPVAACVSASPGTPAHVLINDQTAEHIPGCNMAFWADRLRAIGGFDPIYTKAGDDVDVCWRLQEHGEKIVFNPAAMVWHHRRSTVRAYLQQQIGYGEAEALLKRKHPDKFRGFRAESLWKGRIYTRAGLGLTVGKPVVHYGRFGTGMFQTIYSPPRFWWPLVALSLEWWLVICVLLGMAQVFHPTTIVVPSRIRTAEQLWEAWDATFSATLASQASNPLFLIPCWMFLTTLCVSFLAAGEARPPVHQRRWWSRLLIAAMYMAQPVERAFARYRMRFQTIRIPQGLRTLRQAWEARAGRLLRRRELDLWSETSVGRERLLEGLVELAKKNRWNVRVDPGWEPLDITFYGDRWCKINLTTATDNHGGGRLLTRVRLRLRATLFYNALVCLLWYVLVLGWFANRSPEVSVDDFLTRPWLLLVGFVNNRWELALIPVLVAILWRLRVLWWQLNRTVMASVLNVAEGLGMTVVGAPELLRRPAAEPAPAEVAPQPVVQPVAALAREPLPAVATLPPPVVPQHAVPAEPLPSAQPAPVPPAPILPGPPVAV